MCSMQSNYIVHGAPEPTAFRIQVKRYNNYNRKTIYLSFGCRAGDIKTFGHHILHSINLDVQTKQPINTYNQYNHSWKKIVRMFQMKRTYPILLNIHVYMYLRFVHVATQLAKIPPEIVKEMEDLCTSCINTQ